MNRKRLETAAIRGLAAGIVNTTGQDAPAYDPLRYVFVERIVVECPACNSTDLKTLRSKDQGDGTRAKRTKCLKCDHRFFVIVE